MRLVLLGYRRPLVLAFVVAFLFPAAGAFAQLSGSYTIDPSGSGSTNYTSFSAAISDLVSYGVSGPVTFTVAAGTYSGRITIPAIPGTDATNTVTFDGVSAAQCTLTASHTSYSTSTMRLDGATYVTLRNLNIVATGSSYGMAVHLTNHADNNIIENCVITAPTSTNSYCVALFAGGSYIYNYLANAANYNIIRNNTVNNGYYGIRIQGYYTGLNVGNQVIGNAVMNPYYYGIYMYYDEAPVVIGNTISTRTSNNYGYGMYFGYCTGPDIENNTSISGTAPIYMYGTNTYYGNFSRGKMINNMLVARGNMYYYGMYVYYTQQMDIFHNSVYNSGNYTATYYSAWAMYLYNCGDIDFRNNSIYANSSPNFTYHYGIYARYTTFTNGPAGFDYNNIYSTGKYTAYWDGVYYTNHADFVNGTGLNLHGVSIDPGYVGPTDLHQNTLSHLSHLGTPVGVLADIDGDPRSTTAPAIGCDEGCYVPDGGLAYDLTDASGNSVSYFSGIPQTPIYVRYSISYPLAEAYTATLTLRLYTVGPNPQLAFQTSWPVSKPAGQQVDGIQPILLPPTVMPGFYRAEMDFYTINTCEVFGDSYFNETTMLLGPGQTPCMVWPGDVNNDGIVNYGDRRALNMYIHDANLQPTWLNGPARYRADAATNPFAYLLWEEQIGVPWATADGCYMDADGNGAINNFDYLAIKLNWYKTHGTPKASAQVGDRGFDVAQNYPNPFNPTTTLQYNAPEASQVQIVVHDGLGRRIAELVNARVDAGSYAVPFDASHLPSGEYIATVTMRGLESGLTFTKTVNMTLIK